MIIDPEKEESMQILNGLVQQFIYSHMDETDVIIIVPSKNPDEINYVSGSMSPEQGEAVLAELLERVRERNNLEHNPEKH